MGGVDRLDQNIATYLIAHRSKKWWWPIFHFCVNLCANNAFQIYQHQKENPGQKSFDLLGFRRSIVDTYYRHYKKTQLNSHVSRLKKEKFLMKLSLANWVIGSVKQNNDDVLNVEKQHYIFVKNTLLLYTQNLLRNSMNSDRFTEWLPKKILLLGAALTDIFTIFLCCL